MGPNSHDLRAEFVCFMAKFVPVRVCMSLSRSKFVGLNLRRSEFTFHDLAPFINLHSMLGWLVVFSGAPTFHDSAPLINLAPLFRHHS